MARSTRNAPSPTSSSSRTDGLLRITIDTVDRDGREVTIEVEFDGPRGFRVLDEGDLLHYWEAKVFPPGYHLFEITSGGWRDHELQVPGMLSVSDAIGAREWFVATTNTCVNVLCTTPPRMRDLPQE